MVMKCVGFMTPTKRNVPIYHYCFIFLFRSINSLQLLYSALNCTIELWPVLPSVSQCIMQKIVWVLTGNSTSFNSQAICIYLFPLSCVLGFTMLLQPMHKDCNYLFSLVQFSNTFILAQLESLTYSTFHFYYNSSQQKKKKDKVKFCIIQYFFCNSYCHQNQFQMLPLLTSLSFVLPWCSLSATQLHRCNSLWVHTVKWVLTFWVFWVWFYFALLCFLKNNSRESRK